MIIVENTLPKSEYTHNRLFKIDGAFESIGVYEAEIGSFIIHKGDRIAQAVISPVIHADFEEVDELGDSERGAAGFGSTGVNG
jgi:dUTP pyrophosphatase